MLGITSCAKAPREMTNNKSKTAPIFDKTNKNKRLNSIIKTSIIGAFIGLSTPLSSHELWLEPDRYQAQIGEDIGINLRNGENFSGITLSYFKKRIEQFYWSQGDTIAEIRSRSGDIPAGTLAFDNDGIATVVYQSTPSYLTYAKWEKFENFLKHKDLDKWLDVHSERGLPSEGFKEVYFRFSKALIGIGDGNGSDRAYGLETEFVGLENPYAEDIGDTFEVKLFYQQIIRPNAQVEVFERAPDGTVSVFTTRTSTLGIASIPIKRNHQYLLDSVVLREPSKELAQDFGAVWESLWAALTFEVPE